MMLYKDETAEKLMGKIDYDFSRLKKQAKKTMYRFGFLEVAMRQSDIEWEIREYLQRFPNASVVNLGCGLDDMGRKCDNGKCKIYNLDFADVIAIAWLKDCGNEKIGITGASTTGTLALTASSYFPDLTLTIAMTPSDFIWQGFEQGEKDGYDEWPIEGESLFTYRGEPLPYMPFCYKHPEYGQTMKDEAKSTGNALASRKIFDDSEAVHPITEEEFIKVENIKGRLIMIGADDDSLWDASKYIKRAEKRLEEKPHDCKVVALTYKYGTHFVFPESLMKKIFPIGAGLLLKFIFRSAKEHPHECRQTRIEIDRSVSDAIEEWKSE